MHLKKHNVLAQSLLLTTLFSVFDGSAEQAAAIKRKDIIQPKCTC